MKYGIAALLIGLLLMAAPANAKVAVCPPLGMDKTKLLALKSANWVIADAIARDRLAIELTQCLGNPDPVLRDEIAFEALYHYLRERQVTDATMAKLSSILQAQMTDTDPEGFRRPFSALALAEVARADRIKAYLTAEQRKEMLDAAIAYMKSIEDYRGFDTVSGYRHGVAHASDLMLQLALNPAFDKNDLIGIRDAVAFQLAPEGQYYTTGESERLARPILFLAQRNLITESEWSTWFANVAGPGHLGQWDNWFRSHDGLARKHNLMAFLSAVYVNVELGENAGFAALRPGITAAIKSLP